MIEPVVQLSPGVDLQTAVDPLIKVAENVAIVRWIELPASVLLFLLVPGDPNSGAIYVLAGKKGTWYAVDFEDEQFGGYSLSQLETLLNGDRAAYSHRCAFVPLSRPVFTNAFHLAA